MHVELKAIPAIKTCTRLCNIKECVKELKERIKYEYAFRYILYAYFLNNFKLICEGAKKELTPPLAVCVAVGN